MREVSSTPEVSLTLSSFRRAQLSILLSADSRSPSPPQPQRNDGGDRPSTRLGQTNRILSCQSLLLLSSRALESKLICLFSLPRFLSPGPAAFPVDALKISSSSSSDDQVPSSLPRNPSSQRNVPSPRLEGLHSTLPPSLPSSTRSPSLASRTTPRF